MKKQKAIFLFLALIFPICIFLFLKFFGKNEFSVPPLYVDVYPVSGEGCPTISALPYVVPDSILVQLPFEKDSLIIVHIGRLTNQSSNQLKRVDENFRHYSVGALRLAPTGKNRYWKNCIFFLSEPLDLVLLDRKGVIRGQYECSNRGEIDRLLAELSIILRLY